MIEIERQEDVAILRFCHGKASALDTEFLRAIAQSVEEVEASDAKACILTGKGKIFSAGVDLKRLSEGGSSYLQEFMPALDDAFLKLFTFSKPLVAACNGHAIAGGGVMLACCDARFVANGSGRIGVPELLVGVPFPLLALEIIRSSVPAHQFQEIIYGGATYAVNDALSKGLCDHVVEADQLMESAMKRAEQLSSYPAAAFAFNKKLIRRPTLEVMSQHGEVDGRTVLELWQSDEVQAAVRAYVAKTLG